MNERAKVKRIALATNIMTLAAWFAFLLAAPASVLIVLALGFIALYMLAHAVMFLQV